MRNPLKDKNGYYSIFRVIAVVIVLVLVGYTVLGGIKSVPSGYKGVKLQFGQIVGEADEGLHFVVVWFGQDIVPMSIQTLKVSIADTSCGTVDMQEARIDVTVNYHIDAGFVKEIFRSLRLDWENRVIVNNVQQALKATTAKFRAEELLSKREEVRLNFYNALQSKMNQYHITIEEVQLEDIQFSEAFTRAIEEAATAEQNAIRERNQLEVIRYQQEQAIIKKEAEAKMMRIEAEAYANATVTRAMADSEAIRVVAEQIANNPDYLTKISIEQWDGKLPYYYGGGAAIPFINIGNGTIPVG